MTDPYRDAGRDLYLRLKKEEQIPVKVLVRADGKICEGYIREIYEFPDQTYCEVTFKYYAVYISWEADYNYIASRIKNDQPIEYRVF